MINYNNGNKFIIFRVPEDQAGNPESMISELRNFLSGSCSSQAKKKKDFETLRGKILSGPCQVRVSSRMKHYKRVQFSGHLCPIIAVSRCYVRDEREIF